MAYMNNRPGNKMKSTFCFFKNNEAGTVKKELGPLKAKPALTKLFV
jgi:hypothetical protein